MDNKLFKIMLGIVVFIMQLPIWMFLASTNNPLNFLSLQFPLLILFPLSGLGVILIISGSTPPFVKK